MDRGFGAVLRHYRQAAGLSQQALAERANLSVRGIADLERGARRFPYPETLARLAEGLGLSAAERDELIAAAQRTGLQTEPPHSREPAAEGLGHHNLPGRLPILFGRDEAIAAVRQEVLGTVTGLVTLTGAGGSGKTCLALAVGFSLQDQFPAGVWFVDLAPIPDAELVPGAVLASIGVPQQAGQHPRDTLRRSIADRSLLVILDNCEHLVDACAELVHDLLSVSSQLRVLATSRQSLGVEGERVWRVPLLPTPSADQIPDVPDLLTFPAVALFVERAHAAERTFDLTRRNAGAVVGICSRLDGLPLAIELAAARVRILTPEQILQRLERSFELLAGGYRVAPTRQQTLRATLEWSFQLLPTPQQRLLAQLSVFSGGFDLEAVEAICADGDPSSTDVLQTVAGLVDRSLVLIAPGGDVMRYRLLEPVRQDAQRRLDATPDVKNALWKRHAEYFLRLALNGAEGLKGPQENAWAQRLEREHDNLRIALRRCLDGGEVETALRIGCGLWQYWRSRGYRNEGMRWLEEGLARSDSPVVATVRVRALQQIAELAYSQSDFQRAKAWFEEALTLSRGLDDVAGIANALMRLGRVRGFIARAVGDLEQAEAMIEESLGIFRQIGDTSGVGWALLYLGQTRVDRGDFAHGRDALNEAAALFRQRGESHMLAHTLSSTSRLEIELDNLTEAEAIAREALTAFRGFGCDEGTAEAFWHMGRISQTRGKTAAAGAAYADALPLFRGLGLRYDITRCVDQVAALLAATQPEPAVRLLALAEAQRQALGAGLPLLERARRAQLLSELRQRLRPERFSMTSAVAPAPSVDELVDEACALAASLSAGGDWREASPLSGLRQR